MISPVWRRFRPGGLRAARSSSMIRIGVCRSMALWTWWAMFIEPLPMPDAACTVPLIPGGRSEKNMLTLWASVSQAVHRLSSGEPVHGDREFPPVTGSMVIHAGNDPLGGTHFFLGIRTGDRKHSLFRIPRPVMIRLLAGSSSSAGSASRGQQNGMLIPSFGPAVRK